MGIWKMSVLVSWFVQFDFGSNQFKNTKLKLIPFKLICKIPCPKILTKQKRTMATGGDLWLRYVNVEHLVDEFDDIDVDFRCEPAARKSELFSSLAKVSIATAKERDSKPYEFSEKELKEFSL